MTALAVTHLNESGGLVRFASGDIPADELPAHPVFKELFDEYFLSFSGKELHEASH